MAKVKVERKHLEETIIELLASTREAIEIKTGAGKEVDAQIVAVAKKMLVEIEGMLKGRADSKSCKEFRLKLFGRER